MRLVHVVLAIMLIGSATAAAQILPPAAQPQGVQSAPKAREAWTPPKDEIGDLCDVHASSPTDPTRPRDVGGVEIPQIDPFFAIVSCGAAIESTPNHARRLFQMGRAYEAAGRSYDAATYYGKAASFEHLASIHELADHQLRGPRSDRAYALELLERSSSNGFAPSMLLLGRTLRFGTAGQPDQVAAKRWFEKALGVDEANARRELAAQLASKTNPGGVDFEGAASHWRKLVERRDSDAAFSLALAIKQEQVKPLTAREMEEAFKIALLSGRYLPAIEFAEALALGKGTKRDPERALLQTYEAYDRARNADPMSEDSWIVYQKQAGHFAIETINKNKLRPRSDAEHAQMVSDFGDGEMFEHKVSTDCRSPATVNMYIWNWNRLLPPTHAQEAFNNRVHGCSLDKSARAAVNEAFRTAKLSGQNFRLLAKAALVKSAAPTAPPAAQKQPPVAPLATAPPPAAAKQPLTLDEFMKAAGALTGPAWIGVRLKDVEFQGTKVVDVVTINPLGPSHRKLKEGVKIFAINGVRVQTAAEAAAAIAATKAGGNIVVRDVSKGISSPVDHVLISAARPDRIDVGATCPKEMKVPPQLISFPIYESRTEVSPVNVAFQDVRADTGCFIEATWLRALQLAYIESRKANEPFARHAKAVVAAMGHTKTDGGRLDAQLQTDAEEAARGGAAVRYELAIRYYEGRSRPVNKDLAATWLLMSRDLGSAPAGEYLFNRVDIKVILKSAELRMAAFTHWFGGKFSASDIKDLVFFYESSDIQQSLSSLEKVFGRKHAVDTLRAELAVLSR